MLDTRDQRSALGGNRILRFPKIPMGLAVLEIEDEIDEITRRVQPMTPRGLSLT